MQLLKRKKIPNLWGSWKKVWRGDLQNGYWGIRWFFFYPRLLRWYGEEEPMKYNITLRRNMLKLKDKLAQNICETWGWLFLSDFQLKWKEVWIKKKTRFVWLLWHQTVINTWLTWVFKWSVLHVKLQCQKIRPTNFGSVQELSLHRT
jgi:hypothetical protein